MSIGMVRTLLAATLMASTFCVQNAVSADLSGGNDNSYGRSHNTWQGFYLGALVGAERANFNTSMLNPVSNFDMGAVAFQGGGFLGHNWQWWKFVAGVELDGVVSKLDKENIISGVKYAGASDWKFSMRGRVGVALDNVLLYTTAGLAASKVDFSKDLYTGSQSTTGVVAGIGADIKLLDMLFVRGEYMYSGFAKTNFTLQNANVTTELTGHALRAGVGVKF